MNGFFLEKIDVSSALGEQSTMTPVSGANAHSADVKRLFR
jgi:hypothetical protein